MPAKCRASRIITTNSFLTYMLYIKNLFRKHVYVIIHNIIIIMHTCISQYLWSYLRLQSRDKVGTVPSPIVCPQYQRVPKLS